MTDGNKEGGRSGKNAANRYIRTGSIAYPRIVNYLLYAALAALLVFFFARNIAEGNFAELFSRIKAFFSG